MHCCCRSMRKTYFRHAHASVQLRLLRVTHAAQCTCVRTRVIGGRGRAAVKDVVNWLTVYYTYDSASQEDLGSEKPENNYIIDKYYHVCSQNCTKDIPEHFFIHSFIFHHRSQKWRTVISTMHICFDPLTLLYTSATEWVSKNIFA
jgi:hypothetical protein